MPLKNAAGKTADRYARVLLRVAKDAGELNAVISAVRALLAAVNSVPALRSALTSQTVASSQKGEAIAALLTKINAPALLLNFSSLLERNRRLHLLPLILRRLDALADAESGILDAIVSSPLPLSVEQTSALEKALTEATKRSVRLKTQLEPRLLDGITLRVGNRFFDASAATKLRHLRTALEVV